MPAIAAARSITGGAPAQLFGTYPGSSADGELMSMSVIQAGSTLSIGNADVNMRVDCYHPGRLDYEGWGFYLGQDIVAANINFHTGNHYCDSRGMFYFYNAKAIRGTVSSVTAVFVPGPDPATAAQFCSSPTQNFT